MNKNVKHIAFYTRKIAQLGAIHQSRRTARHDKRSERLKQYKQALNKRLKEEAK